MTEDSTDTAGKPEVRPPMPGQACREIGKRMNGFFDVASISAARYGLTSGLSYVQEFWAWKVDSPTPVLVLPAGSDSRSRFMANQTGLKLKVGDTAPDFTAATNAGGKVSLSDFRGKNVILYFYPRDNTPGCTKEACAFRDEIAEFHKRGAVILGVSTDSPKKHDNFIKKYNLPFTLVADEDKTIVQTYGVWGPKTFMGVPYHGTSRVTFLIGPDGRIKHIWPKVKPAIHAWEILEALNR